MYNCISSRRGLFQISNIWISTASQFQTKKKPSHSVYLFRKSGSLTFGWACITSTILILVLICTILICTILVLTCVIFTQSSTTFCFSTSRISWIDFTENTGRIDWVVFSCALITNKLYYNKLEDFQALQALSKLISLNFKLPGSPGTYFLNASIFFSAAVLPWMEKYNNASKSFFMVVEILFC